MLLMVVFAVILVIASFVFHYRLLLWLAMYLPYPTITAHLRVLFIVMALFVAHIVEIGIYAGVYALSIQFLELGTLTGMSKGGPMEYLYFSSVIYTSLGIGDIHPSGHIRFLTGIETLNGLLLIAWSASFTFLAMGRLWPWTECCEADDTFTMKK